MRQLSRCRRPSVRLPVVPSATEEDSRNSGQAKRAKNAFLLMLASAKGLHTVTEVTSTCETSKPGNDGDGDGSKLGLPIPSKTADAREHSVCFYDDVYFNFGCMNAIATCAKAIATAAAISNKPSPTAVTAIGGGVVPPPLLQTTKGAGTVACRDSAREILRFFGHSPILHLEGVIWVKKSGERGLSVILKREPVSSTSCPETIITVVADRGCLAQVHCIAALSNWSLFLVPLRDPWFGATAASGLHRERQNSSARIIEIPFASIEDVVMVGAREKLNTFASFEANWLSRPFRVVTTTASHRETIGSIAVKTGHRAVSADERILTFVGFDDICRLRHSLVMARESWMMRAAETGGGPAPEILSCNPKSAQQYVEGVYRAMTGPLRTQVNAQVELMEGLADEMVLDTVVKKFFFSTGDVFFEIARILKKSATAEVAVATTTEEGKNRVTEEGLAGSSGDRRSNLRTVVAEARHLSAATAVLDAAFFHSLQVSERVDLVGRAIPVTLPAVAETLVKAYCDLRQRLLNYYDDDDNDDGKGAGGRLGARRHDGSWQSYGIKSSEDMSVCGAGARRTSEENREIEGVGSLDDISTGILDRVVRALNGMSDTIRTFNIEHEHMGLVRNLVGIGLGRVWRAGVHPAASEALSFLVAVNDRAVDLIEGLGRREKNRRKFEAKRQALRPAAIETSDSPISNKGNVVFRSAARLNANMSLTSSKGKSITPPASTRSPPEPADIRIRRGANKSRLPPRVTGANCRPQNTFQGENRKITTFKAGLTSGNCRAKEESGQRERVYGTPLPLAPDFESTSRSFLLGAPVLLFSYTKLLNALVCGSYNLRTAFASSCEADLRNIGREGGYLEILEGLDGGTPRMIFRESARFLYEIFVECGL